MSMPNSSEEVATTHFSSPDFSICSVSARSSLLTDPWCARAITAGAFPATSAEDIICAGSRRRCGDNDSGSCSAAHNSFNLLVRRSAVRRALTNSSVECAAMICAYTSCSMNGQIDFCVGNADSSRGLGPESPKGSSITASPMVEPISGVGRSDMSSTGTRTSKAHFFSAGGLMIRTSRLPPKNSATRSNGRTVADRPIRCGGVVVMRSSRSRLSAR